MTHVFTRLNPCAFFAFYAAYMEELKKVIVKTLLYFDVFSFPLQMEEIHRFCPLPVDSAAILQALKELIREGQIRHSCCFFQYNDQRQRVGRRVRNYQLSKHKIKKAQRNASIINRFPFVRGVAISGSLSKYSADEKADIDFFIITASRRLWICRTLLHIFKKLTFFAGKQHDFCMNYFLDLEELELKDKNIYTAVECATIIPVYGIQATAKFQVQNQWLKQFFPNAPSVFLSANVKELNSRLKKFGEFFFTGHWGDWCNAALRSFTVRRWSKKFERRHFPMQYFENDLRATSGESKYHPNDYQRRILKAYRKKVERFERTKARLSSKSNLL